MRMRFQMVLAAAPTVKILLFWRVFFEQSTHDFT
jgi:hypothetical protein